MMEGLLKFKNVISDRARSRTAIDDQQQSSYTANASHETTEDGKSVRRPKLGSRSIFGKRRATTRNNIPKNE